MPIHQRLIKNAFALGIVKSLDHDNQEAELETITSGKRVVIEAWGYGERVSDRRPELWGRSLAVDVPVPRIGDKIVFFTKARSLVDPSLVFGYLWCFEFELPESLRSKKAP